MARIQAHMGNRQNRIDRDEPPAQFEQLDLSKFCRKSHELQTSIEVNLGYRWNNWLTLGACEIIPHDGNRIWSIKSYFRNHTDCEHDSAYIVRFETIGFEFRMFSYGRVHAEAWIKPDSLDSFFIPTKDWDPYTGAVDCKECKGKNAHKFVEYLPPRNPGLYDLLRGRQIRISTGAKWPK